MDESGIFTISVHVSTRERSKTLIVEKTVLRYSEAKSAADKHREEAEREGDRAHYAYQWQAFPIQL